MKQLEADVAVVAGGTAGLAAAVAAAENGASVIVFEKAATTGGAANMGNGLFAVESRHQIMKQVPLTREEAFKVFMNYTHWRVDARLVKAYIDKSADTIDWLEKMGVEFIEPAAYFPGSHYTWHIIKPLTGRPFDRSGSGVGAAAAMIKTLTDRVKELGGQIFLQTPVKKVLKTDGRITGVVAEDNSGETVEAKAKAVIIATGGCGDNPEMVKKHIGYDIGRDLYSFRVPGLVGDGLRMAWEAGAAQTEMNMEIIYGVPGAMDFNTLSCTFRQPNLVVNLLGERFMSEEIMRNTTFTGNAIATQKNRCAFSIYDEDTVQYYRENGLDFVSYVFRVTNIDNFDAELERVEAGGSEHIFVADSLEELAEKTGINLPALRETVEEYNQACESGRDGLFHKNARYLRPVKKPRFYAGRLFPGAYGSLGGIKINYKAEALTKDYDVIPGLYAAGVDACTIYGDSYVFILPGNTMGFAVNSGRIAGENAAKYVKSTS